MDGYEENGKILSPDNNFIPFQSLVFALERNCKEVLSRGSLGRQFSFNQIQKITGLIVESDIIEVSKMMERKVTWFGPYVDDSQEFETEREKISYYETTSIRGVLRVFTESIIEKMEEYRLPGHEQGWYNTTNYKDAKISYIREPWSTIQKVRGSQKLAFSTSLGNITEIHRDGWDSGVCKTKILSLLVVKREWIPSVVMSLARGAEININAFGIIEDEDFDNKDFHHKGMRSFYRNLKREFLEGIPIVKTKDIYESIMYKPEEDKFHATIEDMEKYGKELISDWNNYLKADKEEAEEPALSVVNQVSSSEVVDDMTNVGSDLLPF
jgi:hypothetical protein